MGRIRRAFDEAAMRFPRGHLSLLPLATLVSPLLSQLKFNGGVSSSSNSNGNSPSASRNTNRPTDVDEKFFFGGDTPSLTGNQALDGGIVGLGLGALWGGSSWPNHPRCSQRGPAEPGLLLWKEKETS